MMLESGWSGLENLSGSIGNLLVRTKDEGAEVEDVWMGTRCQKSCV